MAGSRCEKLSPIFAPLVLQFSAAFCGSHAAFNSAAAVRVTRLRCDKNGRYANTREPITIIGANDKSVQVGTRHKHINIKPLASATHARPVPQQWARVQTGQPLTRIAKEACFEETIG